MLVNDDSPIFDVGVKHKGLSVRLVSDMDPGSLFWASRQSKPGAGLAQFIGWVADKFEIGQDLHALTCKVTMETFTVATPRFLYQDQGRSRERDASHELLPLRRTLARATSAPSSAEMGAVFDICARPASIVGP